MSFRFQNADFTPSMEALRPQIKALVTSCEQILTSESLKQFLILVLQVGNFLNSVSNDIPIVTQMIRGRQTG